MRISLLYYYKPIPYMKLKLVLSRLVIVVLFAFLFFLHKKTPDKTPLHFQVTEGALSRYDEKHDAEEEEMAQQRGEFTEERLRHEYKMLRNPVTGTIPVNYREKELEAASNIP